MRKSSIKDIAGIRFGKLVAVKPDHKDGFGHWYWLCQCDCGNQCVVASSALVRNTTKSCGCYHDAVARISNRTHGESHSRLYKVWKSMRGRCNNKNHISYKDYGGRGIKVCEEWEAFESFQKWANESGYDKSAPRGKCTLDRIDPNGDYCPDNCRWVDNIAQANNRRDTNRYYFQNKLYTIPELSRLCGINSATLSKRIKSGWGTDDAINTSAVIGRNSRPAHNRKKVKIRVKYHADIDRLCYIGGSFKSNWIDLRCAEDINLKKGEYRLVSLGISVELPEGTEAIVVPRSSTFKNYGILLANSMGVIDNSYCGDNDVWKFLAYATKDTCIPKNERICQFRIQKNQPEIEFEEVDHLGNEDRGGIGSTGRV